MVEAFMTIKPVEVNKGFFVPGMFYKFNTLIASNCMPESGGNWVTKVFNGGLCLNRAPGFESFAFQGKPVGEDEKCLFFAEWRDGCIAEKIPPPYLQVVK